MILHNLIHTACALTLDLLLGDPVFPYHPVRLMGKLNRIIERIIKKSPVPDRAGGYMGLAAAVSVPLAILFILLKITRNIPAAAFIVSSAVIYFSLALKDLAKHGLAVKEALERGDTEEARKRVSYLITRDTRNMESREIVRCTIESISENAGDSVIAPVFWSLLWGPAGALFYRAVNTLDAMWGYKTRKYILFGRPSAVLDDILNFIPARITGLLFCICAPAVGGNCVRAWKTMIRDHARVKSPNAGYPEAAMAGALGISLGGPGIYFGKTVEKESMGEDINETDPGMIASAVKLLYISVFLFTSASFAAVTTFLAFA